jgi:asparagine synthase (glutamine-hydrolysing)
MIPVLQHTGAEANQIFPHAEDGGLWDEIEQLVWHQEEPFSSTSIYSQWKVMSLARQRGVTVLMDGQGADELLGGYHHYLGPYLAEMRHIQGMKSAWLAIKNLSVNTARSKSFLLALGIYNSLPLTFQHLLLKLGNTRFRANPTISKGMLNSAFRQQFQDRQLSFSKHQSYRHLDERLYNDIFSHSLPALLRYEDRNSMAFSLEARVPFLDYRLVDFCFSLPVSLRINQGWTKWVLREAMVGFLPEEIRWRRGKLGFATPEQQWLQGGNPWLAKLFCSHEILSKPYLNSSTIRQLQNLEPNSFMLWPGMWRIINLELWLRVFQRTTGC